MLSGAVKVQKKRTLTATRSLWILTHNMESRHMTPKMHQHGGAKAEGSFGSPNGAISNSWTTKITKKPDCCSTKT